MTGLRRIRWVFVALLFFLGLERLIVGFNTFAFTEAFAIVSSENEADILSKELAKSVDQDTSELKESLQPLLQEWATQRVRNGAKDDLISGCGLILAVLLLKPTPWIRKGIKPVSPTK